MDRSLDHSKGLVHHLGEVCCSAKVQLSLGQQSSAMGVQVLEEENKTNKLLLTGQTAFCN